MVTDASGTKVAEMGTFPYGESWYNATSDKLVFTSYERDSESGNDYAQARYHVSGLGRFSSPDPIAGSTSDPQSFNRYSYVRNMPVMLTDPTGTIPGCTTVRNHAPEASSSDADRTGGPSASDFSADPPPQAGCGGGTPCEYTLAGCAGGFGGPGGAAGLDGGFSGDDSGMAPTFGIGQSPGIGGFVMVPFQSWTYLGSGVYGDLPGTFWSVSSGFDFFDYSDWQTGRGSTFYGGSMDAGNLISQAVFALLQPECAALFGGFQNATKSLLNSSYNWYVPGQGNPFPDKTSQRLWQMTVSDFEGGALGITEPTRSPGSIIFFRHALNQLAPGFGTGSQETQMVAFMHEQEHAANHNSNIDHQIDSNYPADFLKINTKCGIKQIEQKNSPIVGELTPP